MSKPKKKVDSQVNTESHELCSPKYTPIDPSVIPFEEWSDSDINMEKWEISKDATDKTELFKDTQIVHLPPSLQGVEWKRPDEIFPDSHFTVFLENPGPPDLMDCNKHLLHSEFVRSFIQSIATLCHLADIGQFHVEYTCLQFTPNTVNHPWRPWHHVYSKCHAGKGQNHHPAVNKIGKYIVRLFWLGSWKKIYVDDMIPVNSDKEILLPYLPSSLPRENVHSVQIKPPSPEKSKKTPPKVSENDKSKSNLEIKNVVELWPLLLAKALMKLASLTWDSSHDLVDFDIVQCLSGWIPHKINTRGMNTDEIWDTCLRYTSQYEWQEIKDKSMTKVKSRSQLSARDQTRKSKSGNLRSKDILEKYSLAICFQHDECTHYSLIEQTRNIPLVKPSSEEDFPQWKRYRWLDWAIENNILPPKASADPIRCLKLLDPLKDSCHDVYGDNHVIHHPFVRVESVRELSRKETESRKLDFSSHLHPTKWLDIGRISDQVNHLMVYFKPSRFSVKARISDMNSKTLTKEVRYPILKTLEESTKLEWKEITRPQTSMYHKNEPIYMITDSLTSKQIIISLSQMGSPEVLQGNTVKLTKEELQDDESECGICLSTIVERLKKKHTEKCKESNKIVIPVIPNEYHEGVLGHLVLCKFKWYSERTDEVVQIIRTYATKTIVLKLPPGRYLFKMFIKTSTGYVIQILSDAPLCVGYLEEIFPLMTNETCLVIKENDALAKTFQSLTKSFGKEDYLENLRHFYNSYTSLYELKKEDLLTIHEIFFKELLQLIADNLSEAEGKAVRILLKQWQLASRKYDLQDTSGFCGEPEAEDMEYVGVLLEATVKIQAFLRGVYERQMMKRHSLSNKYYKATVECLNRVHSLLITKGTNLLRICHLHPDLSNSSENQSCYEDIQNAITLYQVTNSTKVSADSWNFVCRQTFYVMSIQPIPIRINLFCDLDSFSVRVFDNDTCAELKIHTNNVLVDEYRANVSGYTVLCYGSSSVSKQLHYKLCFTVAKETGGKMIYIPHDPIKNAIVTGSYIPTKKNRICRYMIIAQSDDILMTLQFSTNYPNVKINLKLFKDEELIQETEGKGAVLLPIVYLGGSKGHDSKRMNKDESMKSFDKKSTLKGLHKPRSRRHSSNVETKEKFNDIDEIYFMETTVMDDSWPLTASEWRMVERLRADKLWGGPNGIVDKGSKTKKHLSSAEIQGPYWTFQIICDSGDLLKLSPDDKRDVEIRLMKIRWNEVDTTRYATSQELRNKFINENKIPNEEICLNAKTRNSNREMFEEEILVSFDSFCDNYRRIPSEMDTGKRELKDPEKIEKDIETEFDQLVKFREYKEKVNQTIEDMEVAQTDNYNMMKNWYNECLMESESMMDDAHKAKLNYVENITKSANAAKDRGKKEKKTPKKPKKK